MYDNFRVNIGYEHGDRILEYDIEKILKMFFRILYLNLLRVYAASKIVIFQSQNSSAHWITTPNPQ